MVGVQGSALNKWPRGTEVRRDMDTANSSSPPTDKSDGKGIYNLTSTSGDPNGGALDQIWSVFQPDMGEEVYGCISSGYTKNKASPTIEYDADVAIKNRRARKDYPPEGDHFSAVGRKWTGGVESVCIPTENLPLVANSKFQIKYWQEAGEEEEAKMITIQSGAGFTSGALVRPVAFSEKAVEIPNGAYSYTAPGYACKLSDVPIETAHAILNRCKEITLSGSTSLILTRTRAECSGPKSSTMVWTQEVLSGACPPGQCLDKGGSITITCQGESQITKVKLSGDVSMTAYRYKQLADIWKDPKTLDLSGNYFYGSSENGAYLRKVSSSACFEVENDEEEVSIPYPTIEQIAQFEKQTKLSSGCLVYPATNGRILLATQEKNLAGKELNLANCVKAGTGYSLKSILGATNGGGFFSPSSVDPGGSKRGEFSPLLISGPSLACEFHGAGWDYTGLGLGSAQDLYTEACDGGNNFLDHKMKWNSTGIKKSIVSGNCEQQLYGLNRYNKSQGPSCECGDSCGKCVNDHGTLDLTCKCTPLCMKDDTNPCYEGEYLPACDGSFGFAFAIGKYVGAETNGVYSIAPIPLSAKSDTKTEDLTIFWNGSITDGADMNIQLAIPLVLSEQSADRILFWNKDNSTHKYEKRSVGGLTIKCEDWSTSVPIWTVLSIAKQTTCKGVGNAGGYNTRETQAVGTPLKYCRAGCDEDGDGEVDDNLRCCGDGCGGVAGTKKCCHSVACGIDDPCGYSYKTDNVGKECDANNTSPTCDGTCESSGEGDCGCCNCRYDGDDCDVCPPMKVCAPYKLIKDFEPLGCYGDAHEEDQYEASVDLTLEFKLFTEME